METITIIWLSFSLVVGLAAGKRGRGTGNWFVVSLALSPFIGAALLFGSPNLSSDIANPKTHRACPQCAEQVLRAAIKCKHCGSDLVPQHYEETTWDKLTKFR
jgi:hypothetical protein